MGGQVGGLPSIIVHRYLQDPKLLPSANVIQLISSLCAFMSNCDSLLHREGQLALSEVVEKGEFCNVTPPTLLSSLRHRSWNVSNWLIPSFRRVPGLSKMKFAYHGV